MKRDELFTKIITQVSQGNQEEYEALALEIEQKDEMQLCETYQKVLDSLKDNPVEEKELADIIEKSAKQECSQFEVAAYVLGKDFFNNWKVALASVSRSKYINVIPFWYIAYSFSVFTFSMAWL